MKRIRENESGVIGISSSILRVKSFSIEFTESLAENSEEYQTLRKGVRRVLGIIVGLLKDRACAEEEPDRKKARIEGYRSKK
jgi:hypothetical protein